MATDDDFPSSRYSLRPALQHAPTLDDEHSEEAPPGREPAPRPVVAPPRRRRPGGLFVVGIVVVILSAPVVAGSAFGYWVLHRAVKGVHRVDGLRTAPEVDGEPVTYLIIGSDSRDAPQFAADREDFGVTGQRADVIMLVVLDPRRQAAVLLSIPRDTRVDIPGSGLDKINAAYVDGPQAIIDTVSEFTGLSVNHYVEVGFIGFMQLVDAVGRVPICTDRTLTDELVGLYITPGCFQLDGGAALPYVRSRHTMIEVAPGQFEEDPSGDFGRIQRQQQFLRALLKKVAKPGNLPRVPSYVTAVSETVRADPAFGEGDAVALGRRFLRFDPARLYMVSLPGVDVGSVGGVSYVLPSDETTAFLTSLRDGKPLPGEPGGPIDLSTVPVVVKNGNGVEGCAAAVAGALGSAGAKIVDVGDSGRTDLAVTEVRYNPGDRPRGEAVQRALGFGKLVETNRPGPEVEVVVGADAKAVCPQ